MQAGLVEHFSGKDFDDFVRERIFEPLGMRDAVFAIPASKRSRVPTLYASSGPNAGLVAADDPLGANYGDEAFRGLSASTH